MTNSLADLNNHLFAQLDRLAVADLSEDALKQEVARTNAIVAVADQVIDNAKVQLTAAKLFAEHGGTVLEHLPQIGGPGK